MKIRIIFLGLLLSISQVATQNASLISAVEAVGSDHYSSYAVGYVIDGDTSGNSARSFCTRDEDSRFAYLNLNGSYEISYVKVWGRDGTYSGYLNQMQNLTITVADTVDALDEDAALCVYRDGSPAAGENRPETFTCGTTMTGEYVKVSMINVSSDQFLCFNEIEVYGIAATTTTTGGCPQLSKCERACKKKLGQRAFKISRCGLNRRCFCVHKDNRVVAL